MQDYRAFFKGKKITVMGLGLLGRGIGDTAFLAECGAELIVTDLKTEEQLAASLEQLKKFSNITYRLGAHDLADFRDRDMILKAAGVPLNSPYIAEARNAGIPIEMSASFFAKLAEIPIVGVTGTRGKSTTTHLIKAIMKEAGKHVLLGGNIRGVSTLALLPEVTPQSYGVFELDSWQLQGFGDSKISPQVAVFTTFMPDHLNYYGGDLDLYFADKAQIFVNQKPEDTLVVGVDVAPRIKESYGARVVSHVVIADGAKFPKGWHIAMPGEHNKLNAMCAIEATRALGIDDDVIQKAVAQFTGVEGRLQFLREVNGVKIYNDNNATTPDATIAALCALDTGNKNTVLIMGGDDKNLDMSTLITEIPLSCKAVVLFKERGTDRIRDEVFALEKVGVRVFEEEGLPATVARAAEVARPGDTILYSPAFSSFGKYFKNEYDRSDQFVALAQAL